MEVSILDECNSNLTITPCIKECVLNSEGYCTGCFRTMKEIAGWDELRHEERLRIMEELPARKLLLGVNQ